MSRFLVIAVVPSVAPGSTARPRADDAEDRAVALVEKLGGEVTRDENRPGKPVVFAGLRGTKVTDADLKSLAALKNLDTLNLSGTKVTDAGAKELAKLDSLTWLLLLDTPVGDAGAKELAKLKNLILLCPFRSLFKPSRRQPFAPQPVVERASSLRLRRRLIARRTRAGR